MDSATHQGRESLGTAELGSAVPVVAAVLGVAVAAMLAVVEVGEVVADRAQAQAAADMAALAGVFEGLTGARALAGANGGELQAFTERDGEVSVTVEVGRGRARATARYDWAFEG